AWRSHSIAPAAAPRVDRLPRRKRARSRSRLAARRARAAARTGRLRRSGLVRVAAGSGDRPCDRAIRADRTHGRIARVGGAAAVYGTGAATLRGRPGYVDRSDGDRGAPAAAARASGTGHG